MIRVVLRSISWRAVLITQSLAMLFAVTPWLEQWGAPTQPHLPFELLKESVTALCVMLAAFTADEWVRRGWTILRAFTLTMLVACVAASLTQLRAGHLPGLVDAFFGVGAFWAIPMLVYLNRQSAARLLVIVQQGEQRRVQAERRLLESDLAAAQAQINPAAVLQQLSQVRELHAAGDPGAERELELLIADLRNTVTRCAT
jgi:sensor histidine kinase YesM